LTVNAQSVRGQSTARTLAPTSPNAAIASQPHVPTAPSASARPPKKEVVIAAAAMRMPDRVRSSCTTLSCIECARFASSYASW